MACRRRQRASQIRRQLKNTARTQHVHLQHQQRATQQTGEATSINVRTPVLEKQRASLRSPCRVDPHGGRLAADIFDGVVGSASALPHFRTVSGFAACRSTSLSQSWSLLSSSSASQSSTPTSRIAVCPCIAFERIGVVIITIVIVSVVVVIDVAATAVVAAPGVIVVDWRHRRCRRNCVVVVERRRRISCWCAGWMPVAGWLLVAGRLGVWRVVVVWSVGSPVSCCLRLRLRCPWSLLLLVCLLAG